MTVTWTGGYKNQERYEGVVSGTTDIGGATYISVKVGNYYSVVPESIVEVKE